MNEEKKNKKIQEVNDWVELRDSWTRKRFDYQERWHGWQSPVGLTDNSNSYFMNFDIASGNISIYIITGGITGTSSPIEINKWYHICATIDSLDNQSFYVNGSLIGSSVGSLPIPSYTKFRIGGDSENTRGFKGYVDEFIVYNRVLSASEVEKLANAKNVTDSVVVYAPLDKANYKLDDTLEKLDEVHEELEITN